MMLNMIKANPLEMLIQGGLSVLGSDNMKKAGFDLNKTVFFQALSVKPFDVLIFYVDEAVLHVPGFDYYLVLFVEFNDMLEFVL